MINKRGISCEFTEIDSIDELPTDEQVLLKQAKQAMLRAHAPYSKFKVGAAVLMSNGEIIQGNNQENASYPHGTCGEKVAINYAHSLYNNENIIKLAITASNEHGDLDHPVAPCGGCRQNIMEMEQLQNNPITIILQSDNSKVYKIESMKNLLPLTFGGDDLK